MHILTGLVIAGLARMQQTGGLKGLSLMPHLRTGPVRTEHASPGRLRLRVPSLPGNDAGAERLVERLPGVNGVDSVQVNRTTGSVLIHYRAEEVRPELLFAAVVRLMGLEEEIARPPKALVTRELRSMLSAANRVVYDRTGGLLDLWSAVMILLAAIGIRKMVTDGLARALPGGFTMVWWAMHALARDGGGEE